MSTPFLSRKSLPHAIPGWVHQGARHFVTFNVTNRTDKPLVVPSVARALLQGIGEYESQYRWFVWLAVIMPDHIHLIATFNLEHGLAQTVRAWKSYQARILGISWQRDFFEHRLRNDDAFQEKCAYIRMNPVRKGLCATPEEWPYIHEGKHG